MTDAYSTSDEDRDDGTESECWDYQTFKKKVTNAKKLGRINRSQLELQIMRYQPHVATNEQDSFRLQLLNEWKDAIIASQTEKEQPRSTDRSGNGEHACPLVSVVKALDCRTWHAVGVSCVVGIVVGYLFFNNRSPPLWYWSVS